MKLASGYSTLVNGGKAVTPTILDRVQDGQGKTIFVNGDKRCADCQQAEFSGGPPPELPDERAVVIDPVTAYQITFMLKGVVDNGTGWRARALQRPMAGKTGTTNDSYDTWFMGYSPDLVAGVYVGMDNPEQMGKETGSSASSPIFVDFMAEALKGQPKVPFRIPEGVTLAPVNRNTGEPSYIGAPDFILEAFRPGTEPSIGALKSTIRVGSGTDSFGSYGFDSGGYDFDVGDEDEKADDNNEKLAEKTDGSNVTLKDRVKDLLEEIEGSSEDSETAPKDDAASEDFSEVSGETPENEAGPDENGEAVTVEPVTQKPVAVAVKTPLKPKPKPKAEEDAVEDDLDDGLY